MMMVNLELERRLQWSRREGGSRVTVSMLCEENGVLGKKKKRKGKFGRKGSF